ncbi:MAG: DMT family transporter [Granulosicoccus sp.]
MAVLWALFATAMFTLAAAMSKVAVVDYHVLQILFFRQIIVLLSCLPSLVQSFPDSLMTRRPAVHASRLLGAFVALSCGIWAVSVLPLTTATTLGFVQVFFVALVASLVLKEIVGLHRISAIMVGFLGVVVVMQPGSTGFINSYALIPIAGAMGAAVAIISVRKLSQTESTATLLLYQALFIGAMAGVPLLWFWTTPPLNDTLFLLGTGMVAAAANWAGVKALRLGEASLVANVQYMQLVYAAVFGWVLFNEVPDKYTLMGAVLIIGSSIYLLHREAISKRTTNVN